MGGGRRIGALLEDMTVSEVTDDGAGKKAGLKEGDTILKVNGTKVADPMEMARALRAGEPKKTVTVLRGGKEVELKFEWAAPAPAPVAAPAKAQ